MFVNGQAAFTAGGVVARLFGVSAKGSRDGMEVGM